MKPISRIALALVVAFLVAVAVPTHPDANRRVDSGMNVSDAGIDCTGYSDSTTAFQTAVNAMPDGGVLWFPSGCRMKLSSTITINSRANIGFRSASHGGVGGCGGEVPQIIWTASGGTVFDFEYTDIPLIDGLSFRTTGSAYVDTFLNFDRRGSGRKTGTAGRILNSCFSNGSNKTSDFSAIYIAPTTNSNEENYIVDNIQVQCSTSEAAFRSRDGSIDRSSTTLTSATAKFVGSDAGSTIWLTYPGFFLKTTILSVIDDTTIVLGAKPSVTQTNVTIYTGQGYGNAIHVGYSQNSIQHQFININYFRCDKGIYMEGGSAEIRHPNGGQSDYGVYMNSLVQNTSIDYYESEDDLRGIETVSPTAPVVVTNTRMSNGSQFGDGFLKFGGSTILMSSLVTNTPPANTVLIGYNDNPHLTSIGNIFVAGSTNLTREQIGYSDFGLFPVTTINDMYDATTGSPHNFGCFINNAASGNQPASCVTVIGRYGHQNSTGVVISSVNYYRDNSYYGTDVSVSQSLNMTTRTADTVAPGATLSRVETVCGTEPGTAKIIVYAGTSATPTTLLDNIGSGVSGC